MTTRLSDHFLLEELVNPKCKRDACALPFDQCVQNLTLLCQMILEPWRAAAGPLAVNSGLRDIEFSAALASDPASAARVKKRAGPHCYGLCADIRVLNIDKLVEPDRSTAYLNAFADLYHLVQNGLPVHEAILEFRSGLPAKGQETSNRITHIHVQYKPGVQPARRFVARRWKLNEGVLAENYVPWRP